MRSPAGKPFEQVNPVGAQGRLELDLDRLHPAGLHCRQEVGADIGEALGGHTQRNRIDGGQLSTDRSHIEGDGGGLIPQEDCHSLRGGLQVTQACDGQPAGLIQGGQHLGQGHGSAGNGRRWESFALGVLGHGFSSFGSFGSGQEGSREDRHGLQWQFGNATISQMGRVLHESIPEYS